MVAAIRRAFFGNTPVVAASGQTGPRAPAENSAESDMGAEGKRESCLARSDAHGTLSGKPDTPRSPRRGVVAQNRRVHPRATGISRPPHRGATPTRPRHRARAKEGERRAQRDTTPAETRFSQKSFPDFIFPERGDARAADLVPDYPRRLRPPLLSRHPPQPAAARPRLAGQGQLGRISRHRPPAHTTASAAAPDSRMRTPRMSPRTSSRASPKPSISSKRIPRAARSAAG